MPPPRAPTPRPPPRPNPRPKMREHLPRNPAAMKYAAPTPPYDPIVPLPHELPVIEATLQGGLNDVEKRRDIEIARRK